MKTEHMIVLGFVGLVVVSVVARKGLNALNPASPKNIVYKTVNPGNSLDSTFARLTLLNPFASSQAKEEARNLLLVLELSDPQSNESLMNDLDNYLATVRPATTNAASTITRYEF